MSRNDTLRAILVEAAREARAPDDFGAIARRASHRRRRRRQRARLGSAMVVLALALAGAATVGSNRPSGERVVSDRGRTPVGDVATADPDALPEPSQTPTDAARDGIVPAVANLPYNQRVSVVRSASTAEGRWILSRLAGAEAPNCVLGDATGTYGRDFVCTVEYGELLLVDSDDDAIIRAFPMPGYPPREMAVTEDAVYCGRQGDGALPASMLCRVDRRTLMLQGRLFPMDGPDALGSLDPPPAGQWVVEPPSDRIGFDQLTTDPDGLLTTRAFTVDRRSLEVSRR